MMVSLSQTRLKEYYKINWDVIQDIMEEHKMNTRILNIKAIIIDSKANMKHQIILNLEKIRALKWLIVIKLVIILRIPQRNLEMVF